MFERREVTIHTDGSCLGNPGPGGWAAILVFGQNEKTLRGFNVATTNNQMELMAVIAAVSALLVPCDATIYTDSQYVCNMQNKDVWKRWMKKPNLPNRDLWQMLYDVTTAGHHIVHFEKVQGHAGNEYNERCDKIAREQAAKAKEELSRQAA